MFHLYLEKTFKALQNNKFCQSLDLAQLLVAPWRPIILRELWPTWLAKPGQTLFAVKKNIKN